MKFASAHSGSGTGSTTGAAIWKRSACTPTLTRPDRVHLSFQALPPDVRRYGHLDRQRAPQEIEEVGALDSQAMQETLPGETDARSAITCMATCSAMGPTGAIDFPRASKPFAILHEEE